ncbi:leucine-rich repeat domain-containing protein [Nonomuraea sp. MG754425]|uniref:leucine-rich repeat domain-containing protein n=1 Tax=Nonomuraea sp. MG754425 TaxID=2570319 RepID=UPI001F2E96B5|nr:leucine-rich repeat domain-containing protein [Nonomuraea sp. MG754425]MCF6473431.1 leucine-rich repeat domain-containing protein [Nonomuraea sp. MG754425]
MITPPHEPPYITVLRSKLGTTSEARAWKAVRELTRQPAPAGHARTALTLAGQFATKLTSPHTDKLLKLWPESTDPEIFAELVLAPAFVREGRTELTLTKVASAPGLRHLTALRSLRFERCRTLSDLSEVGELTGLTELDLSGCVSVADVAPLAALTALSSLDLQGCTLVSDLSPLLKLHELRALNLMQTSVASLDGIGAGMPLLENLDLHSCRALRDITPLSGLRRLTTLWLSGNPNLNGLTGLGHHPRLTSLGTPTCPLTDLDALSRLPALTELTVYKRNRLTSLKGLEEHPSISEVHLLETDRLKDFSALATMPALRELSLYQLHHLSDLTAFTGLAHLERLVMYQGRRLHSLGDIKLPALRSLNLYDCESLTDLGDMSGLPALSEVRIKGCPNLPATTATDLRSLGIEVHLS